MTVEDAYPLKQGAIEARTYFRYDRTRDVEGKNRYWTVPRVEYRIFPNAQIKMRHPTGSRCQRNRQGDVRVQGLYNFNSESIWVPALSVAAGVTKPYGRDAGGTETELKFLATKPIGTFDLGGYSPFSYVPRRIHFNASWFHNHDPLPGHDGRTERSVSGRLGLQSAGDQ
ncbi:hypothetical protein ACVW1C_008471 [Bradyrhizobium sp. USDA 4011]